MSASRFALFAGLAALFLPTLADAALAQSSTPELSIVEKWLGSGHGNASSPSFTHWNAQGAIPETCALCHSGAGFREYYGLDGSEPGMIAHPVPTGGVVDCETCHADGIVDIASVTFPSGIEIEATASTVTCYTCHGGRQSGLRVETVTAGQDDDSVNSELSFINIHYAPAAATLLGHDARGGYEYPGKTYLGRFEHVPGFADCSDCHDPHSLAVEPQSCVGCHQTAELRDIRFSRTDFDGDGDTRSGIYSEIASLHERLYGLIEDYAEELAGTAIAYAARNPYFFVAQDDGQAGSDRYASFTPRLLRAAYNYQFVRQDKGAYAHNPHYAIQILHDSIEDLSGSLGVSMDGLTRP